MGLSAAAAIGGMLVASQMSKAPSIPAPAAPEAPPASQAAKAPQAADVRQSMQGRGQAGGSPGVSETFLTGPGGVDPRTLLLGRSTLLGG